LPASNFETRYKPDLANSPWKSPPLFFLLELDDFSSLELEESAFFELLETAFAEELVSMTVSSFSLSLLAAMVESPSQLAQNAAVTERTIFFQCLFKKMLICLPFGEKYTKIRR